MEAPDRMVERKQTAKYELRAADKRKAQLPSVLSKDLILWYGGYVERPKDWVSLLKGMRESFAPVGDMEALLVEEIAAVYWRRKRAYRYEGALVGEKNAELKIRKAQPKIRRALAFPDEKGIRSLERYHAILDRQLNSNFKLLEKLQKRPMKMREGVEIREMPKIIEMEVVDRGDEGDDGVPGPVRAPSDDAHGEGAGDEKGDEQGRLDGGSEGTGGDPEEADGHRPELQEEGAGGKGEDGEGEGGGEGVPDGGRPDDEGVGSGGGHEGFGRLFEDDGADL